MRSKRAPRFAAACACAVAITALGQVAGAQGARTWQVQADSVIVNSTTQTVDARGRVRISDGRIVLTAARATYSIRGRRITLTSAVTVTSPQGTLRSREATIFLARNNTLDRLEARGAVAGRSGANALAADRLVYALATDTVTASGQVRLTAPSGTATGRTLTGDLRRRTGTLTAARVQTKEGTIAGDRLDLAGSSRQAVLRGNVRGAFGAMTVTSDAATVYERERKVVFRGRVRVIRPGQSLQADTVTFFYGENRLIAEGQTRVIIQESP